MLRATLRDPLANPLVSLFLLATLGSIPCGVAPAEEAVTSSLRGKVVFTGERPAPKILAVDDRDFQAAHFEPVLDPAIRIAEDGSVADVLVHVDADPPAGERAPFPDPHALIYRDYLLTPRVVALEVGHTLSVCNDDEKNHNLSIRPQENRSVNVLLTPAMTYGIRFDRSESPFMVLCDCHPWEAAWIAVFDHPWFAVTAEDGTFEIRGLAPGSHDVTAWHAKFGETRAKVDVPASGAAEVTLEFSHH